MKYVLILEDNASSLAALQKALMGLDCKITVCTASSTEEAWRILYDYRIDLFILDIILTTVVPGDTSGIRFAEKLRTIEQYKFTPIIFTTALADPEMYAYRNLHSFGYLEKPFDMKVAVELIEKAFEFPKFDSKRKIEYFRKDGILIAVDLRNVLYAETCRRKMYIHMKNEILEIPYLGIKQFLKQCQMNEFVQCSRYAVVNMSYVKNIDPTRKILELQNGDRLDVGAAFVKKLRILK